MEAPDQGKSVVDQVMDGIISQIISGELTPGGKLPTEMELCRQFGAGRNSVREAVKKLQAYGLLYIKRADGTFVSEKYNRKMLDPMLYSLILQHNSWKDFVELRSVIDIGTLNIIVQRTDLERFLPELYLTLGQLSAELHSQTPRLERILELDMQFHSRIAGAANNPMLGTITEYITLLTLPSRRETTRKVIESGETDNFVELHRRLLTVIERRQAEQIVQAVQDHYVYWK